MGPKFKSLVVEAKSKVIHPCMSNLDKMILSKKEKWTKGIEKTKTKKATRNKMVLSRKCDWKTIFDNLISLAYRSRRALIKN